MRHVPLLLVPFVVYNAFAFLIFEDFSGDFRDATMFELTLPSGAIFSLSVSAAIILLALLLSAFEVMKATRIGATTIMDHVLATALFIAFLIEFLIVPEAATSTFLVLLAIALIDLICGFAVSIRSATRDVNFEP